MSQGNGWVDSGERSIRISGGPQEALVRRLIDSITEDARMRQVGERYQFSTTEVPQDIDFNQVALPLIMRLMELGLDCSVRGDALPDGSTKVVMSLRKQW